MKDILEKIGHISEVERTLQVFNQSDTRSLAKEEIIRLAKRLAGQSARYPHPHYALIFAEQLGLVKKKGGKFSLTPLGKEYVAINAVSNIPQGRFLLSLLLDNNIVREYVREVFEKAHDENGLLCVTGGTLVTPDSQDTMRFLQQVGCFKYEGTSFILNSEFEGIVQDLISTHSALGEDELWKRLEFQRRRGVYIEECVVTSERTRLMTSHRPELANAVLRVSAQDVGAGYDVLSFEVDGTRRHIEVKSSVGKKLKFEWSEHERAIAEKLGDRYWIYFVPLSYLVNNILTSLVCIKNPIKKLKEKFLRAQPSTWSVSLTDKSEGKIQSKISENQPFNW